MRLRIIFFSILTLLLNSCNLINRNRMFETPEDYQFSAVRDDIDIDYKIAPNDVISFQLFANDGFQLINITDGNAAAATIQGLGSYTVEPDGFIKLPVVHRIYVKGLTVRQLEMMLEDIFSEFYHKPFVILKVSDRKIFLFAGAQSRIIPLTTNNTTLFEILAGIGGLPENSYADQIKIIRGNPKNPEVYKIDLSTIDGMKNAGLVIQRNDIIYIQTRKETVQKSFALLTPYLSILSTGLLIWGLAIGFGR